MHWFSFSRDGFVLLVAVLLLVMLGGGLTGDYRLFGYALVGLLGLLVGLAFVRQGRRVTWIPPIVATIVLALGMRGMFVNESVVVRSVADTVLGFHPGTAFLIYAVWIPAFFTLGVSFAVLFPQLADDGSPDGSARRSAAEDAAR
jgi:hypothetical protein